jgi:8-oxo-dGTP diphosphatase
VLLVKRAFEPFKDHWDIPGGFCDGPELPIDAAIREVFEETGLVTTPGRPVAILLDD